MELKSLKTNAALNTVYTMLNIAFPLITYPYVLRVLSVDGIGVVNFFSALSGYAAVLADLGISIYGIRAISQKRENKGELARVVKELLFINYISTFIVVAMYVLLCMYSDNLSKEISLIIINFFVILTAPLSMNWLFPGLEEYSYITKRSLVIKSITLVLIFGLVRNRDDYVVYAGILALSSLLTNFANFLYARRLIGFKYCGNIDCWRHFRPMIILFGSLLAVNVYINLDTVMLGLICDNYEVGIYTIAVKIKSVLLSLVNAISVVMLPRLSYYIAQKMLDEYNDALKRMIDFIFIITVPITVLFMVKAQDCVYILGGAEFSDAALCMQLLMPILIISGFSNVIGNQILIPLGKDMDFTKAVSMGAVVDIILNILLMKPYGCLGAAVATLIAECFQMSYQLSCARTMISDNISYKNIMKVGVASIFAMFGLINISVLFSGDLLVNMLVSTIFFGILYLVLLYFLKVSYAKQFVKYLTCLCKKRFC